MVRVGWVRGIGVWCAGGLVLVLLGLAVRTHSPSLHLVEIRPSTVKLTDRWEHPPRPLPQPSKEKDCSNGACRRGKWIPNLPTLYTVTPTYPRAEQVPELTRFAQTLMNVPNVVWIVSEDAPRTTPALVTYLNETNLSTVYLRVQMPAKYHKVKNKPRGVANRMAGLNWIRENAKEGVLYFADDDNTYDIRIFEEMRWTKKVSMFPVGLVTKLGVSTPIVKSGKVVGFYDGWIAKRTFPIDMAGFAVNIQYLLGHPQASMPYKVGYEEDGFMKSLGIKPEEIEPLAHNCTKIWVWHTQTKKNEPATPVVRNNATRGTNLDQISQLLWKGPASNSGAKPKSGSSDGSIKVL